MKIKLRFWLLPVALLVFLGIGLVSFLSPCALPAWAAPQGLNCTCTWWEAKPCSGWAAYLNKAISCGLDGKDQDGRPCNGCCYAQTCITDTPEPAATATRTPAPTKTSTPTPTKTRNPTKMPTPVPTKTSTPTRTPSATASPAGTATLTPTDTGTPTLTPTPLPPVVNAGLACDQWGLDDWCLDNVRLVLMASDPQGLPLNITGSAGSEPFACGASCEVPLPEGQGLATYTVTSASGLSVSGEQVWKYDNLPPVSSLHLDGDPGANDWYVSVVQANGTGTDAISGVREVRVRVAGGDWQASAGLSDGVHQVQVRVRDYAGWENNSDAVTVKVDTTPPGLSMIPSGTLGDGGYFCSPVAVSLAGTDAGSGVSGVEYRLDGLDWEPAEGVTIAKDGDHRLEGRVTDLAGNVTLKYIAVSMDTLPPVTGFILPRPGRKVVGMGTVAIEGWISDAGSGPARVELSLDNGLAWQPLAAMDGLWRYSWDTGPLPNGEYPVLVRGRDRAGNAESPAGESRIVVANRPPLVELQERWNIWEAGWLHVAENGGIPVETVRITIRDRKDRWPEVVREYAIRNTPKQVAWDRRFANGIPAPSGEYEVVVEVRDIYGNRSSDKGVIVIPFVAMAATSGTAVSLPSPNPAKTGTAIPIQTSEPVQTVAATITVAAQITPSPVPAKPGKPLPIWPVVGLMGMLLALASAAVADGRPHALRRMKETFGQIMKNQGE